MVNSNFLINLQNLTAVNCMVHCTIRKTQKNLSSVTLLEILDRPSKMEPIGPIL